ncbi:MAG: hypothetical protein ACOWWO_08385 [Peptococcaceae bacterium]
MFSLFVFIILLIIGFLFWYSNRQKWEELLTTQNPEKYMNIIGKLQSSGIKYKTTSGGEEFNFRKNTLNSQIPPISYTIWVYKNHAHKAYKIIND